MPRSQASDGPVITVLDDPDRARFWGKVKITSDRESCWLWQGSFDGYGYGLICIKGKTKRAHRLAYTEAKGAIPEGISLLHTCDNPPCVRPSHLRPGTRAENNKDRDEKGRHWSHAGEAHHAAKLTEEDVREIRNAPRGYGKNKELAERYGVSAGHIHQVRSGRVWKQVSA